MAGRRAMVYDAIMNFSGTAPSVRRLIDDISLDMPRLL